MIELLIDTFQSVSQKSATASVKLVFGFSIVGELKDIASQSCKL